MSILNSSRSCLSPIVLLVLIAILPLLVTTQNVIGIGSTLNPAAELQRLRREEEQLKARLQSIEMEKSVLQQELEQFQQQQEQVKDQLGAKFIQYVLIVSGIIVAILSILLSFNFAIRFYRNRSQVKDNSWVRLTEAERQAIIAMRRNRTP